MSRRTVIIVLLLLWAAAFGWSVLGARIAEPTGSGFTRGMNRLGLFLGWQVVAVTVAAVTFILGRDLPRGGLRRLTWLPLICAGLLVAAVLAVIGNAWMQDILHPPQPYVPPGEVTAPAE